MKDFFLKLDHVRNHCDQDLAASDFLKNISRLYLVLMRTQVELDSETLNQINALRNENPRDQDEAFHFLWFLNSYARYLFFILNKKKESMDLTLNILIQSEDLFKKEFSENNSEKRCLCLILVLNVLRLTTYSKNYTVAQEQYFEMKSFIDLDPNFTFNSFPLSVQHILKKYGVLLQTYLNLENKSYFQDKLSEVRQKIQQGLATTLLDSFYFNVESSAESIAFIDYDIQKTYSWRHLNGLSENLSMQLNDLQRTSPYVLICTRQNIIFPAIILACWKRNYIPIMIYDQYTESELFDIQRVLNTEDVLVVLDSGFENQIIEKFKKLSSQILVIDLHNVAPIQVQSSVRVEPRQLALGLLTSGTTTLPKLCLYTHADLLSGAQIELENEKYKSSDLIANLRPHFTSAGLNTFWPSLIMGCKNLFSELIRTKPIPRFLNELISEYELSHLVLSPSYIVALFGTEQDNLITPYYLRLYFGGNSLPPTIIQKLLMNKFLPSMRYGMTEVVHIISKQNYENDNAAYSSSIVGYPNIGFELKINNEVLFVLSKGVASYQLQNGQLAPLVREGWYQTEDHAKYTSLGALQLNGRQNKSIAIHGFRFHSDQVETVILENKQVVDCRALAIRTTSNELELVVFIILTETAVQSVVKNSITQVLNQRLSSFKWPQKYVFLKTWPLMPNGKINFYYLEKMSQSSN